MSNLRHTRFQRRWVSTLGSYGIWCREVEEQLCNPEDASIRFIQNVGTLRCITRYRFIWNFSLRGFTYVFFKLTIIETTLEIFGVMISLFALGKFPVLVSAQTLYTCTGEVYGSTLSCLPSILIEDCVPCFSHFTWLPKEPLPHPLSPIRIHYSQASEIHKTI
jgi:hypothetical protein